MRYLFGFLLTLANSARLASTRLDSEAGKLRESRRAMTATIPLFAID